MTRIKLSETVEIRDLYARVNGMQSDYQALAVRQAGVINGKNASQEAFEEGVIPEPSSEALATYLSEGAATPFRVASRAFPNTMHRLVVEGDSKAATLGGGSWRGALVWAMSQYPVMLAYDPSTDNIAQPGAHTDQTATLGPNSQVPPVSVPYGINTPERRAILAARVAAGCDVLLLYIGANSLPTRGLNVAADIMSYCQYFLSIGGKRIILMSVDIRSGYANEVIYANRTLEDYANSDPRIRFVDHTSSTLKAAGTTYDFEGTNTDTFGNYSYDGIHETTLAVVTKVRLLGEALRAVAPMRLPRMFNRGDVYSQTLNNRGNLYGGIGRFEGSGGSPSGFLGTIATGTVPAGWQILGGDANLTLTFSDVPCTYLNTLFGRTDFVAKRMAFSGTPAANNFFIMRPLSHPGVATLTAGNPFSPELVFTSNGLTGCSGIQLSYASNIATKPAWGSHSYVPTARIPPFSGDFVLKRPAPWSWDNGMTSYSPQIQIATLAGVATGGSIDLVSFDMRQLQALPALTFP